MASVLQKLLGSELPSYTFVDFCAGAGGPTPSIERSVNKALLQQSSEPGSISNGVSEGTWMSKKPKKQAQKKISNGDDFILPDHYPNPPARSKAAKRSAHLHNDSQTIAAATQCLLMSKTAPWLLANTFCSAQGLSSHTASTRQREQ